MQSNIKPAVIRTNQVIFNGFEISNRGMYTIKTLEEGLGIKKTWFYQKIKEKVFNRKKIGKIYLLYGSELNDFMLKSDK